jgi:hypothetical protein
MLRLDQLKKLMSNPTLSEGDGAARIPLSETIDAVLDALNDYAGTLAARQRSKGQELSDELELEGTGQPRPPERARHVAVRIETCDDALWWASGQTEEAYLGL